MWRQTVDATCASVWTDRAQLALEVARKGVLPDGKLVGELDGSHSERLGRDVDVLRSIRVGQENKRSGQERQEEGCQELRQRRAGDQLRDLTVIAVIDIDAMAVVEPLQRPRHVDVEVKVGRVA